MNISKRTLSVDDLMHWRNETVLIYASDTVNGQRLKLRFHACGNYDVVYGEKELYCGVQPNGAIVAYNEAIKKDGAE